MHRYIRKGMHFNGADFSNGNPEMVVAL